VRRNVSKNKHTNTMALAMLVSISELVNVLLKNVNYVCVYSLFAVVEKLSALIKTTISWMKPISRSHDFQMPSV